MAAGLKREEVATDEERKGREGKRKEGEGLVSVGMEERRVGHLHSSPATFLTQYIRK